MNKGTKDNPYGAHLNSHSCCGGVESCIDCKWTVKFGKLVYCAFCPGRTALHQIIKGSRSNELYHGCIWCKHYHKSLKCDTCHDCLSTEELANFKLRDDI